MYKKYLLHVFIIIFIFAVETSFISGLPLYLSNLNLLLVALIFVLGLGDLEIAVLYSLGFGILMDIFSFSFFGVHIASLILTMLSANFLLVKFFTDRSLYTFLALVGLATVIYELFANSLDFIVSVLSNKERIVIWNGAFLKAELYQIVYNLAVCFLIFCLVHYISNSLKPVFLLKKKK